MKVHAYTYLILLVAVASKLGCAYQGPNPTVIRGRRACLEGLIAGTAGILIGTKEANAVISSKYCASGRGEGCSELSEGNDFIRSLQEKSAAKADIYAQEARNAYYMKNYPDVFAVDGKKMIKKPDGTFMIVSETEMKELLENNRIGLEFPKAMGGKVTDLTQKPIMLLKD